MKAYQAEHSISMMAKVLKLSRSGYYTWLNRVESQRSRENRVLTQLLTQRIREIHVATRGIYGAPRIHAQLKTEGYQASKKRVARLMKVAEIMGITRRKKWKTTKRDENQKPAPDLVERQFNANHANQLWVADITHVPTQT
jgi:putative transposase